MKLLAFLALCLASVALVGLFAFAIAGMPGWAIGSGCTVAWSLLVASRETDAARTDAEWNDARRHPRL
jgi:hypothetical protein